ncbi:DIRP domain-containing protein [Forsythia ovata]|uniref:DIRP domain-containing protein n=1 Tax=Forsythia ovata TaxID=205694 RepID=A0ABD1WCW1_9LAMI
MSNYAENRDMCPVALPEERALNLMPEVHARAEDDHGQKSTTVAAESSDEMTPRLFGVSIGVKRARSEDDLAEDQGRLDYYIDEDDLEGSTKADTGELARYKSHMMESDSPGTARHKGKNLESAKGGVDYNSENHLDDIKEECSRTEEGQRIGTMRGNFDIEVTYAKIQGRLERRAKRSFLEEVHQFFLNSFRVMFQIPFCCSGSCSCMIA